MISELFFGIFNSVTEIFAGVLRRRRNPWMGERRRSTERLKIPDGFLAASPEKIIWHTNLFLNPETA